MYVCSDGGSGGSVERSTGERRCVCVCVCVKLRGARALIVIVILVVGEDFGYDEGCDGVKGGVDGS